MATYGSALTAGHFWKDPKVTKRSSPHHSAPRLGSVCPHSGFGAWAAAMGHPWPSAANPASCRVTHPPKPAFGQRGFMGRLRSKAKARARRPDSRPEWLNQKQADVGAGLPAMQAIRYVRDTPVMPSQASQLPHLNRDRLSILVGLKAAAFAFAFAPHHSSRLSGRCALAFAFAFDLRRPVKHAGRNSAGIWGVNRQGCRFSRPAPWMARDGGPPNSCRITGTPSVSEVPSVGARAFCLLLRFSKVSRRKGGTPISHHLKNGYVHPKKGPTQ